MERGLLAFNSLFGIPIPPIEGGRDGVFQLPLRDSDSFDTSSMIPKRLSTPSSGFAIALYTISHVHIHLSTPSSGFGKKY